MFGKFLWKYSWLYADYSYRLIIWLIKSQGKHSKSFALILYGCILINEWNSFLLMLKTNVFSSLNYYFCQKVYNLKFIFSRHFFDCYSYKVDLINSPLKRLSLWLTNEPLTSLFWFHPHFYFCEEIQLWRDPLLSFLIFLIVFSHELEILWWLFILVLLMYLVFFQHSCSIIA